MESLTEIQALKSFLGSLFGKTTSKEIQTGSVSSSQIEKQAKEILSAIVKRNDLKVKKVESKRRADGVVLRYHVSIGDHKYIMKCYVVFETRYTTIDLWTDDNQKLLDILAVGDLKKKYTLRAMAKIRLRPWVK